MLVTENITINGRAFTRTYSDKRCYVEREGERYSEAVDPVEFGRQYVETDEKIEEVNTDEEVPAEEALAIITGGAV